MAGELNNKMLTFMKTNIQYLNNHAISKFFRWVKTKKTTKNSFLQL